jgi:hypothetical protein
MEVRERDGEKEMGAWTTGKGPKRKEEGRPYKREVLVPVLIDLPLSLPYGEPTTPVRPSIHL